MLSHLSDDEFVRYPYFSTPLEVELQKRMEGLLEANKAQEELLETGYRFLGRIRTVIEAIPDCDLTVGGESTLLGNVVDNLNAVIEEFIDSDTEEFYQPS